MILNTFPKKLALAALIAFGGIVWLNRLHEFFYSRSAIQFPPVSNWLRDALIVLVPVMLAVWIGMGLVQWMIDRFGQRLSLSTQSILAAAILGALTSLATIVIEANRVFQTGIGSEFNFLANICGRLYPNGNPLLSILNWLLPVTQAFRFHILIQDGANLALINLGITIFLILILEGFGSRRNSFHLETT